MAEDTQTGGGESLPAIQRPQRAAVVSDIPIYDTARFEHQGRIATVIARSMLMPQTLMGDGFEQAQANAFLVVSMAERWGLEPTQVCQACSIVYGKLMLEGKLVAAILESKLGIELKHYYKGDRGKDDRRIYVTDVEITEDEFKALEPGNYPFRLTQRMIDGSIAEWRTREKGGAVNKAWSDPQQADMQLRYRGDRVWTRAFRSALLLGVYTPDEMSHLRDDREEMREVREAPLLTAGFGEAGEIAPRTDPKPEPKATPPAEDEKKEEEPEAVQAGVAAPGESYFLEGDPWKGSGGRRATYKDGKPFSTATKKALDKGEIQIYAKHAPEPISEGDANAGRNALGHDHDPQTGEVIDHPTKTAGASGAASGQDSSASATAASGASAEGTSSPADTSQASDDGGKATASAGEPAAGDQASGGATSDDAGPANDLGTVENPEEEPPYPKVFEDAEAKINAETNWLSIKQSIRTLQATDEFKAAPESFARRIRGVAYARFKRLVDQGTEKTPINSDPFLFRMWMHYGATSSKEIKGLFPALVRTPDYQKMTDGQKNGFGQEMNSVCATMDEAG